MPVDGETTRILFVRTLGQICSICEMADRAAAPESGKSRTCCCDFAVAPPSPSSVSPSFRNNSRICVTCPAVPRTMRLRVVRSASTRGAFGSGLSSLLLKSLLIAMTAVWGSTFDRAITSTCFDSFCIWSIVARMVACWGGVANAMTLPPSLSAVSTTLGSLCSSICSIFTTNSGSAVETG